MENLNDSTANAYVQALANQGVGYAIAVLIHFNVIVDTRFCLFPFGVIIGGCRK